MRLFHFIHILVFFILLLLLSSIFFVLFCFVAGVTEGDEQKEERVRGSDVERRGEVEETEGWRRR